MLYEINRNYSEKRDFRRMRVDSVITLRINDSEKTIDGICVDLSGAGMLIETEERIDVGVNLYATIPSKNEAFSPLETVIRVLRCTEKSNGKFEIGTEIISQ